MQQKSHHFSTVMPQFAQLEQLSKSSGEIDAPNKSREMGLAGEMGISDDTANSRNFSRRSLGIEETRLGGGMSPGPRGKPFYVFNPMALSINIIVRDPMSVLVFVLAHEAHALSRAPAISSCASLTRKL